MRAAATDWSNSPLSMVTSLIKDGSHGSHIDFDGGIPLLSAKDVLDGKLLIPDDCRRISPSDYASIHKNYEISPGDILVTIVGTIGRSCLISDNESQFSVQRSVAILRPDGICSEYLHQVIRSYQFQQQLRDFTNASAQGGVYLSSLAKCAVSYPSDITEQAKIAEILSTVDRAIEQTEAIITKQQRIKAGLMQDLLTKGIDEHGVIRSKATHKFKDSPLGRIPVEWEVVQLSELADAVDPQPDHRTPPQVDDGIPYIGISDFNKDGSIDFASSRKISIAAYRKQTESFAVKDGDFIYGKIGTIGLPKLLPTTVKFALSANVILIKPKDETNFVFWWMISPVVDSLVALEIHSTSQPAFGIQKIRNLAIPKFDHEERVRISSAFDKHANAIKIEEDQLSKFRKLKIGLMHDLLTGTVRVSIP